MARQKSLKECMAEIAVKANESKCPYAEHINNFNAKAQQNHVSDEKILSKIKQEMSHLPKGDIETIGSHISEDCAAYFSQVLGAADQATGNPEGDF